MQREILFRGELSHVNIWVEGNLIIANNGCQYIIPSDVFEPDGHHLIIDSDDPWRVDENTICQFTGLTDKNGTKVFEGDIIKAPSGRLYVVIWYTWINDEKRNKFLTDRCKFTGWCISKYGINPSDTLDRETLKGKVIGNVYDNPELIYG